MKGGEKDLINRCPHANAEEKCEMKEKLAKQKRGKVSGEAPAKNTRSETNTKPHVVGQVFSTTSNTHPTTRQISLSDGSASTTTHDRCDDGSDASVVSASSAFRCVTNEIGRIFKFSLVSVKLPL